MIHETAQISPDAVIGDECDIGPGVRIDGSFSCGDYCKIHRDTWISGRVSLGHCVWIGQGCILDGRYYLDGADGHFAGIGAGSQLWTHCAHGDRMQGCDVGENAGVDGLLTLDIDTWILPMSMCPPKWYASRTVYSGNPAKVFRTWVKSEPDIVRSRWTNLCATYARETNSAPPMEQYDPIRRTYVKTGSPEEVAFNRWLFHGRAYFRPEEE